MYITLSDCVLLLPCGCRPTSVVRPAVRITVCSVYMLVHSTCTYTYRYTYRYVCPMLYQLAVGLQSCVTNCQFKYSDEPLDPALPSRLLVTSQRSHAAFALSEMNVYPGGLCVAAARVSQLFKSFSVLHLLRSDGQYTEYQDSTNL